MKDEIIIRSIKEGSRKDYLKELYKRTLPKVRTYILRNSGNHADVEDVFQDGVIILVQKVKDGSFNPDYSIDGFIYSVCRNLWINKAKVAARTNLKEELPDVLSNNDRDQLGDMISEEKLNVVKEVFSMLGEGCEKLLRLTIIQEYSMKEVVEELGYANTNMAKTYNYRCRLRLLKLFEEKPALLTYFKGANA